MITYVNTVFVGKGNAMLTTLPTTYANSNVGKFIVTDKNGTVLTSTTAATADEIKIGFVTDKAYTNKLGKKHIIKWSGIINKNGIKSYNADTYSSSKESEEKIVITATNANMTVKPGMRFVLRLTFKDLPARFRKWTESYEYVANASNTSVASVLQGLGNVINNDYKRARIDASYSAAVLTLTAKSYDDDDVVDSISWANKVRFNANMWYTDIKSSGFDSKNKYSIDGLQIAKTPGKQYAASTKLVRDREAMSFGYEGILNRGEGTYPIIKPNMNVQLDKNYDYFTLEFENMYRSADDLQRKTKQSVEVYDIAESTGLVALKAIINAFVTSTAPEAASTQSTTSGN